MNASGETADQIVRMSLQGIEVAANVALKAGGMASKSLAVTLYAILTDKKKVKGKTHLDTLLKSGKELKVFAIRHEDLKLFCEEAKHYGVLYAVLKEKNNTDGICDIMVRAEDASKISRIVDKFELATIDTKAIRESIMSERTDTPLKDIPALSDQEHDDLVNSLMASTKKVEKEDKPYTENPTIARTLKKNDIQSEHISKKANVVEESSKKPSVRNELKQIKKERDTKIAEMKKPKKTKSKKKIKRKVR